MIIEFIASALMGYLLGSIPFGLILSRRAGLGDIRTIGSGNIGATNVLRTGRKDIALATLLLDGAKAALAVLLAMQFGLRPEVAGIAALIGHCFPLWLKFRGGKGVATFLGALLALWLPAAIFACALWLGTMMLTRISSLCALVSTAATPLILFAMGKPVYAIATLIMALIVFMRHKDNIRRLIAGTEAKLGNSKNAPKATPQI